MSVMAMLCPVTSPTRSCHDTLLTCPVLSGLADGAMASIEAKTKVLPNFEEAQVIFRSGSEAGQMHFVLAGQVEIRDGHGLVLEVVDEGGFFGEIGALFEGRRAADAVVSRGPCQVAALARADLEQVMAEFGCRDQIVECGQALPRVREWFIQRLPLFAECAAEPEFISRVAQLLQVHTAASGEALMREGEEGNEMFFIFSGSVEISSRQSGREVVRKSAPDSFGELALLYNEPRTASVRCSTACRMYKLEQHALHTLLQEFPGVIGKLYSTAQGAQNVKEHFIQKIPLFQTMAHNEEFVSNLATALQSESVAPNQFFARQGDASDGRMFVIAHGHAEVLQRRSSDSPAAVVATLRAGDFFGELALLLDTPRVASVVARGHCHVYTLSRDAFETLAVAYPDWWRSLTSERGALIEKVKSAGVGIGAEATTKTHGLQLPGVAGVAASTLLRSAESPANDCSIPEEKLCCVCRASEKCVLSVPCGHIAACEECHKQLAACPLCRAEIAQGIKAFF